MSDCLGVVVMVVVVEIEQGYHELCSQNCNWLEFGPPLHFIFP